MNSALWQQLVGPSDCKREVCVWYLHQENLFRQQRLFSIHAFQKHLSNVHNPDNYHLCSHCHFKARTLTNARFHMITKHNDFSLGKVTM